MTSEQAREYLQSIALTAVQLQSLVSMLDQQEMASLREMDQDLSDLLDWLEEGEE